MTELQKKELELLKRFVEICESEKLRYWLVCGSALGAVKYGGFIPWDDDIDVALPRPDYERFLTIAQDRLPSWCFVQNYRTDPEFHLLGTKLRDSRTTFIEVMTDSLDINHGVYIDVFPLDGYPDDMEEYRKQRIEFDAKRRVRLNYRRISRENALDLKTNYYHAMYRLFGKYSDTSSAIRRFDEYAASFDTATAEKWCNHANSDSLDEFAPRDVYGQGKEAVFEGLSVKAPEKFDEYLTQKYGDWRVDLPDSEKVGHHLTVKRDLDRPYTEYIGKK